MTAEAERVVVILDASREVSPRAIEGIWLGLSLRPGDTLIFLGVLHQVINPSTLSFMGAGKLLGYANKLNSSSMLGTNQKIIDEAVYRKDEELHNNEEIMKISRQCEKENIKCIIKVLAGPSLKMVAVKAAISYEATWVILDRHIKKDRRYFLEKLSCKISRMKRDNSVEQLSGLKTRGNTKLQEEDFAHSHCTYDEMIPGSPPPKNSAKKSQNSQKANYLVEEPGGEGGGEPPWKTNRKSTSFPKSSSSEQPIKGTKSKNAHLQFQEEQCNSNIERETESREIISNTINPDESPKQDGENESWIEARNPVNENSRKSGCLVCQNRRPKTGLKKTDFTYSELYAATGGFSDNNYLSEGGFGSVYKGKINGLTVAVKLHKSASLQGEKEFKAEVAVLSKARHENLVMLLGSCAEGTQRLLVYEYVCLGSLDRHLSKDTRKPLSWENRMKIAMGAAKGLQYLHENNIIHRDMRPSNILVTHDYQALLGDFGLARTQRGSGDSDNSSETRVVGTLGYLAPEYAEWGRASTKTDVYSFGVVLLQLITGLKTTDKKLGGNSLVGWARPLLKERKYPDLIDPRILDSHDVLQLFLMVGIAQKCLRKDPQKRATMDTVVENLKYITEGNGNWNIRGFSPTLSDSGSSFHESTESPSQREDESSSVEITSMNVSTQMSTGTLPLSPPLLEARQRIPKFDRLL